MTAKVIRIPEREAEPLENEDEAGAQPTGWDPFQVWRERVLLPRLEETEAGQAPPQRRGKRSVLKRLRRAKKD